MQTSSAWAAEDNALNTEGVDDRERAVMGHGKGRGGDDGGARVCDEARGGLQRVHGEVRGL